MDIWGPLSITSIYGHRYFLTIMDDFSRHTWLFLLKHKSEVPACIISFVNMIETQFSCKVRTVRSDNGPEFNMSSFFSSKGIIHQRSCVETPQQNGVVERKYQQILNITRALMFQSNLPKHFWNFAISHAVHILNRLPSKSLLTKTPFEALHNRHLDFSMLRIFGCECFVSTLSAHRTKLDPRAKRGSIWVIELA